MCSLPPHSVTRLLTQPRDHQSSRWQRGEKVGVKFYLAQDPHLNDCEASKPVSRLTSWKRSTTRSVPSRRSRPSECTRGAPDSIEKPFRGAGHHIERERTSDWLIPVVPGTFVAVMFLLESIRETTMLWFLTFLRKLSGRVLPIFSQTADSRNMSGLRLFMMSLLIFVPCCSLWYLGHILVLPKYLLKAPGVPWVVQEASLAILFLLVCAIGTLVYWLWKLSHTWPVKSEFPDIDEASEKGHLIRFPKQAEPVRKPGSDWQEHHTLTRQDDFAPPDGTTRSNDTPVGPRPAGSAVPELPGLELQEKLGQGGMGVVYRAWDARLAQLRAIKVIRRVRGLEDEAEQRFHREARAVARLDHPGIVRIFALGEHAEALYICMELMDGGGLDGRLRQGPLGVRVATDLVRRVAMAVQHAHEHLVLHRDLKPANVLLAADGSPKVADFGLAKLLDVEDGLTQTGAVMGTASYMAPEQADGRPESVGVAADVWALGTILYECLSGRLAFKGATRSATLELVKRGRPVPLSGLRPEIPPELEAICSKCLEKRPERRFATAGALAEALGGWLESSAGEGRPQRRGWSKRGLRRVWLAAALLVLVVSGGGLIVLVRPGSVAPSDPPARTAVLVPGTWHPLLDREPKAIHWPVPGNHSHKLYRPEIPELMVSCEGLGLMELGRTSAPRYQVAMTIHQNPWAGGIGLFLGYQTRRVGEQDVVTYQTLELVSVPPPAGSINPHFRVFWVQTTLPAVEGQRPLSSRRIGHSRPFILSADDHRIEVTVGSRGLEGVSWDGTVLPELCTGSATAPPREGDYAGAFGIYAENGNGAFREAFYLFHEEQR
jgi:hypothetical protein